MSEQFTIKKTPATAADITPEWIANVRATIVRDDHKVFKGPDASLEILDGTNGKKYLLNLPGETCYFVTKADCDLIFDQLKP